jgi:hypothetical protein
MTPITLTYKGDPIYKNQDGNNVSTLNDLAIFDKPFCGTRFEKNDLPLSFLNSYYS